MTDRLVECLLARRDADEVAAWQAWRAGTDVNDIAWSQALLIPMLGRERLKRLADGDPAMPILQGLVRRAWTEGMMKAQVARDLRERLIASGIGPVSIGGSVAAFLHGATSGRIRPVTDLVLFLSREQVARAIVRLQDEAWQPADAVPSAPAMNWRTCLWLRRGPDALRLCWRHVGTPPWRSRAVERSLFARPDELVPVEQLIVARVAARDPESVPISLPADLVFMQSLAPDWHVVLEALTRWAPHGLARLRAFHGPETRSQWGEGQVATWTRCEHAAWRGVWRAQAALQRTVWRR